ncbi:MAG TPA: phosphate-starvation-inducible PsiE family protein [Ktedonobacterales bacterium]|nr:phosphate-starvation-inducible PsiE family protein [Ktedonobacterales bacterium]
MNIHRTHHRQKNQVYAGIENPLRRWTLRVLDGLDLVIYALVGLAFFVAALLALAFSFENLLSDFAIHLPLPGVVQDVLSFVSDLLLVLIIMEVLSTVRSYLEKGDTSVKPFLFIGIISATRGILSIGARLSIQSPPLTGDEFRNAIIELGIDALVIIVLGITIRVMGKAADQPDEAPQLVEADGHAGGAHDQVKVQTTVTTHQHPDPLPTQD